MVQGCRWVRLVRELDCGPQNLTELFWCQLDQRGTLREKDAKHCSASPRGLGEGPTQTQTPTPNSNEGF